jgi:8-oxo-dGTP pyrophosphatase MutT (NUDIX family)
MGVDRSAKSAPKSRIAKGRQQVAAVCYRVEKPGIEFLLVQTRDGRWIFPKGGVEPGLTHAQSAALEAVEEAGVHGRIEEMPFARYFRRRPDPKTPVDSNSAEHAVTAYLCEVSRLEPPQESNRNPTWFSAAKAKQRLLKDRAPEFGAELARVVDRALSRIQRLQSVRNTNLESRMHCDALQKVRFEAFEGRPLPDDLNAALVRSFLRQGQISIRRSALRLGAGANSPAEPENKITAIDSGRRTNLSEPGSSPPSMHKASRKVAGASTNRSRN